MNWIYNPEYTEDGELKKASGQYTYSDCLFPYSVRSPPNGKTPYEVHIRLLSPETGKTLQVEGKRRQKKKKTFSAKEQKMFEDGKQVEKLNATTTVYIRDGTEAAVKAAVKKGAERLYRQNYHTIKKALKSMASAASIHALAMYHTYGKEFFLTFYTKNKASTRKEKQNALESICASLDDKPIDELTTTDLHTVYQTLAKSKATGLFAMAEKFFEFCRGKAYTGPNPVTKYLEASAAKKGKKSPGGDKAEKIHRIDQDKEEPLRKQIKKKIGTQFAMVILLAIDAGLNVKEIQELKWKDVLIDGVGMDRTVQIRIFHPEYTGGTQNYTRPLLPAGRQLLLSHYDQLREKHTVRALEKMYVVPDANDPKKQATTSAITSHIRSELLQSKIALYGVKNGKHPGGAGIILCNEHYRHMLQEQCGIDSTSADMTFLTGGEIKQITDDYYVSYIGTDGERRLEGTVRRDSRCAPEPVLAKPITERKTKDGNVEKTLHASGADKLIGCIGKVVIPPGGQLYIYSEYGLQGDANIRVSDYGDPATEKFEY